MPGTYNPTDAELRRLLGALNVDDEEAKSLSDLKALLTKALLTAESAGKQLQYVDPTQLASIPRSSPALLKDFEPGLMFSLQENMEAMVMGMPQGPALPDAWYELRMKLCGLVSEWISLGCTDRPAPPATYGCSRRPHLRRSS
jgi:hypothetical protein